MHKFLICAPSTPSQVLQDGVEPEQVHSVVKYPSIQDVVESSGSILELHKRDESSSEI